MFIGHFGLAFAAKKVDMRGSLGTYIIAAQFLDLLWPMLLVRDIETVTIEPHTSGFTALNFVYYPYSHSLFFAFVWAILFGILYFLITKDKRTSLLISGLVVSHWVLDFFTHRADLPLSLWSNQKVGMGLWNNPTATIIIELIIFLGGVSLYLRSTHAKNLSGKISCWVFIIFLLGIYFMDASGPPPESAHSIGLLGLGQLLLVAWGYWIDSNREPIDDMKVIPPYTPQTY